MKPEAKPVASGRPFDAHFIEVAREAGLTDLNVWGAADHKKYIIEAKGSGLAFFDYDCDGWFDIFKTNFADDTRNLYHNNGDGNFSGVTFSSGIGINNPAVLITCERFFHDDRGLLAWRSTKMWDRWLSRSPRAFYTGYSKVLLGLSLTAPIYVGEWSTLRRAWLGSFLLANVPGWDCSSAIFAT